MTASIGIQWNKTSRERREKEDKKKQEDERGRKRKRKNSLFPEVVAIVLFFSRQEFLVPFRFFPKDTILEQTIPGREKGKKKERKREKRKKLKGRKLEQCEVSELLDFSFNFHLSGRLSKLFLCRRKKKERGTRKRKKGKKTEKRVFQTN